MNNFEQIYEQYEQDLNNNEQDLNGNQCKNCNSDKLINQDDEQICEYCGCINGYTHVHGYNESYNVYKKVFYKRYNYLSDKIKQINGFPSTNNLDFIFKLVMKEINGAEINYYNIREILKRHNLGQYYSIINHILIKN